MDICINESNYVELYKLNVSELGNDEKGLRPVYYIYDKSKKMRIRKLIIEYLINLLNTNKMNKVHDFKMNETDFSGYHLGFFESLYVREELTFNERDFVRFFELSDNGRVLTGKTILFEIDCITETIEEGVFIGLQRLHLTKV